ncbi:MAG: AmmeMemoRadiSam system protein A, partial [Gammaproteobacteria bacterium]|nr:AmmeMemoRadiSam system protein A [Gammaproteobacteria bacterium]
EHRLLEGGYLDVDLKTVPDSLLRPGASFVTLSLQGQLRGCIGHLEATQPLVQDVVENASLAAFSDPRFSPLTPGEFKNIEISLSVLSAPEPLLFDSEADLLGKIRPGIDGLILKEGAFRGTFLPSVWESLPEPIEFLRRLKQKAGLGADYWSDSLQVLRYTAQQIKALS